MNWCSPGLSADGNPIESEPCGFRAMLPPNSPPNVLVTVRCNCTSPAAQGYRCHLGGAFTVASSVGRAFNYDPHLFCGCDKSGNSYRGACVLLGQGLPLRWELCFVSTFLWFYSQLRSFLALAVMHWSPEAQSLLRCLLLTLIGWLNLDPSGLNNRGHQVLGLFQISQRPGDFKIFSLLGLINAGKE